MSEKKNVEKKENFSEPVISQDVAELEIEKWFDYRRTRPDLRNKPNSITGVDLSREALVNSMMYGLLSYNESSGELIQILSFPLKRESGEIELSQLVYKPRLTRLEVINASRGIKATDIEGKQAAYLSATTGVAIGKLNKLDESDRGLADTIAGYFLT
jgi:hypothetical protein